MRKNYFLSFFMVTILDTGSNPAAENMRIDASLLEELAIQNKPILHLYDWETESLTYGYFIRPEKYLQVEELKKRNIAFARRPTGGGIVFHIWDLAFSFLMPSSHKEFSLNPLDNYYFVNGLVLEAMKKFIQNRPAIELIPDHFPVGHAHSEHFCMARPTKYDVVWQGLKIAGAAQRLKKGGYLHQGTISLGAPSEDLLTSVLVSNEAILQAMQKYTFAPLGKNYSKELLSSARTQVKNLLIQQFQERLE